MIKDDHYIPPPDTQSHGGGSIGQPQYDSAGHQIGIQTGQNQDDPYGDQPGQYDPYGMNGANGAGGGGSGGGVPLGGSGAKAGAAYGGAGATGTTAAGGATTPWYSTVGKFFAPGATTGGGAALSTAAQVLPWLQFAASYIESQKSGTFKEIPMSPEQKSMFEWAMHYIQTTPDNRATIDQMLKYDLGHPATLDMAALRAGKTGYTPSSHMPGVDLTAMIRNNAAGMSNPGAAPAPSASGYGGGDSIADTIRNIQSP